MHESSPSVRAVRPTRRTALGKWLARAGDQLRFWAKPPVAVGFIAVVVSFVDWRESLQLLGNLRPAPVLFALVLVTLGLTLSTLKWQVLLAVHAVRLSFLRFLVLLERRSGSFFSNLNNHSQTLRARLEDSLCCHHLIQPHLELAGLLDDLHDLSPALAPAVTPGTCSRP